MPTLLSYYFLTHSLTSKDTQFSAFNERLKFLREHVQKSCHVSLKSLCLRDVGGQRITLYVCSSVARSKNFSTQRFSNQKRFYMSAGNRPTSAPVNKTCASLFVMQLCVYVCVCADKSMRCLHVFIFA